MSVRRITSRSNPKIAHVRKLIADKEYRYARKEYVIEGIRVLDSVRSPRAVFVLEGRDMPPVRREETYIVPAEVFRSIASTEHSQGVVVVAGLVVRGPGDLKKDASYVLADRLQDPGNMGTIIRTACAFGLQGVIVTPGCVDPFSPKAVRSAASCLEKLDIVSIDSPDELRGHTLVGADMNGAPVSAFRWPGNYILAVGSEAHGLSEDIKANARSFVSIPIRSVESLNAAVAAGILLFAASSQRATR